LPTGEVARPACALMIPKGILNDASSIYLQCPTKDNRILTAMLVLQVVEDEGEMPTGPDRPVKLSIESTPEFMQLPLEYQGFCAWTVLNRRGTTATLESVTSACLI
jgi:hypothetical protein